MNKTINFCGDSFCKKLESPAWTYLLAELLNCKILGGGKDGAAHEHAIRTFDEIADYTVFCWTEPHRLYHSDYSLNTASAEYNKKSNKVYAAAYAYYKYVHDYNYGIERQMRELYWFDHEVLSKYSGKIVHCWCFEQTYDWKHGAVYNESLKALEKNHSGMINHFNKEQNYNLAHELYNLIRRTYG